MLAFTFVCSKMSTCLQVKDKKYFAVLGCMSVIVIWRFLIELTGRGGGENSIFEHFFVYHCHGLSRPPVEVVGFAHLAKQTHEGGLGRKQ